MVVWDIHAVNKPERLDHSLHSNADTGLQGTCANVSALGKSKSIGCHVSMSMTSIVNIILGASGIRTVPGGQDKASRPKHRQLSTAC